MQSQVAADDLVKFRLKFHSNDKDSSLKYTKMVHLLSADSTPEETLLWLCKLKSVINNQRTSMADDKISTLLQMYKNNYGQSWKQNLLQMIPVPSTLLTFYYPCQWIQY